MMMMMMMMMMTDTDNECNDKIYENKSVGIIKLIQKLKTTPGSGRKAQMDSFF